MNREDQKKSRQKKKNTKNQKAFFEEDTTQETKVEKYLLYKLLDVQRNASADQIKKGYRRMALKHHPDKAQAEDRQKATQQFQKLTQAYQILSNPEKKAIYDQTGILDGNDDDFFSAYQFFFTKRVKLTMDDIDAYLKKFQGSGNQDEQLISYYNKKKGNIKKIISEFPGSQNKDIQRFVKKIQDLIKQGKIKSYIKSFNNCKTKIQKVFQDIDQTKEQFQERTKKTKIITKAAVINLEQENKDEEGRDSDYETQQEVEVSDEKIYLRQGKPRLKTSKK